MDPIAIYAAAVATASLLWQAYTWYQSRRVRIIVETHLDYDHELEEEEASILSSEELEKASQSFVVIEELLKIDKDLSDASSDEAMALVLSRHGLSLESLEPRISQLKKQIPEEFEYPIAQLLLERDGPNQDVEDRLQSDGLPNALIVTSINESSLDAQVKDISLTQQRRNHLGQDGNQPATISHKPEQSTLEARSKTRESIWLADAILYNFNVSEQFQVQLKLWTGEAIHSEHDRLAPKELEQRIRSKYVDLNERFTKQLGLKKQFNIIGIEYSHQIYQIRRYYSPSRQF